MIYLDNSATTKPCPQAVDAMTKALTENWANPSALYNFGIETGHKLRDARTALAKAMGAEPDRVFFTSGGTEADNWAIFSTVKRMGKRGKHIITTAIEHHAILHCMADLESKGFEVTYLQPDALGNISLAHVSVPSVDIGLPQLAMHSCYETAAVSDAIALEEAMATITDETVAK